MKVIFLDVDGVLNCETSTSNCRGYTGIDKDKVEKLKAIVDATNAKIVLISDWKEGWMPGKQYQPNRHPFAAYLDEKLFEYGQLTIFDKTHELVSSDRGFGIKAWVNAYPDITDWVVLDDEVFKDYAKNKITPQHLILTNPKEGLTEEKVAETVQLLNRYV